ncbi:MAG: RDD family protein [Candidatus Bathyarchaeota archaeon]|nr:RDD family protein [Candidatus Bathyarchaeota archaeon]
MRRAEGILQMSQLRKRSASAMTYLTPCVRGLLESEFYPNPNAPIRHVDGLNGTAAERILSEGALQQHWVKRTIAILIDSIIIGIATAILGLLTGVSGIFNWMALPFVMGLIFVLYFTVTESIYGYTMGKRMVNLKVIKTNGKKPSLESAFIRNISKIHILLLLLDTLGGFFTSKDNHQRYIDQIANTTVV